MWIQRIVLLLILANHLQAQQLVCENRAPEGHTGVKRSGDGTFEIEIQGKDADRGYYWPNEVYTITLKGLKTRYSSKKFLEFLLVTESEKQGMMGQSGLVTTGIFHIVDDSLARFSDYCPDGVVNSNLRPKSEISLLWTAPSVLVASCITFKATVVERPHVWYMDEGQLTKVICPYVPPTTTSSTTPTPSVSRVEVKSLDDTKDTSIPASKCCACDEAKYDVTFEGIWSKETHPKDFPENKWLLHFSDIIGASHSPNYFFWESGKLASDGIRHVAEWGATRILENELKAKARGLWHPNEKGQTSAAFRVDRSRHLMSLVTMIGPSPDWFVGISGFDLCTSNCTWLEDIHINLYPYDAGTDSGISYMSPNEPKIPAGLIEPITESQPNDPRSPLFDPTNRPMQPFAKLHLRRQRIYPKSCSNTELPQTELHEIVVSENTEDVGRPECAVSDWSSWSECSVTCGKGLRMRNRTYLIPFKADMMRCDRQLEEKEMCLGDSSTCGEEDDTGADSICEVSNWSDWTPCDRQCGKGTQTRTRRYMNHMGWKKCSFEMTETEMCEGQGAGCGQIDHENHSPQEMDIVDLECHVSEWSLFSPCSASCGPGIRERTRFFLIPPGSPVLPKCLNIELSEFVNCTGEYGSCTIGMEEAKGICLLSADVGPCRFWKTKFAYSPEKGMCVPMEYGGCKGNRNRFDTDMECMKTCGFLAGNGDIEGRTNIQVTSEKYSLPPVPLTKPIVVTQSTTPHEPIVDGVLDGFDLIEEEEPIDCVVSKYSDWSLCQGDCGEIGYMTRIREIIIEPLDAKNKPAKKCPKVLTKRRTCRVIC